jgi:hypothetical protein
MKLRRTGLDGVPYTVDVNTDRGYFSVTVSSARTGGCQHELAVALVPWLASIVPLHLADAECGAPMYAETDGWYWMAGHLGGMGQGFHGANGNFPKTPEKCLQVFAEHARVSLDEARGLAVVCTMAAEDGGPKAARKVFALWIDAQSPRWAREAAEARALIEGKTAQYSSVLGGVAGAALAACAAPSAARLIAASLS